MADWRPPRPRPQKPPQIVVDSANGEYITGNTHYETSPSTAGTPISARNLLPQFPPGPFAQAPVAHPIYNTNGGSQSSERLITPPVLQRPRIFHGYSPDSPSPLSSRKTSLESAGSRDHLQEAVPSPFDDPRGDETINTQTAAQKYNIIPTPDLILFPEDVEADDYLHNPDPNEKDKNKFVFWSKRGMVNVGGLIFVTLGVLALFVAYPVMYE